MQIRSDGQPIVLNAEPHTGLFASVVSEGGVGGGVMGAEYLFSGGAVTRVEQVHVCVRE